MADFIQIIESKYLGIEKVTKDIDRGHRDLHRHQRPAASGRTTLVWCKMSKMRLILSIINGVIIACKPAKSGSYSFMGYTYDCYLLAARIPKNRDKFHSCYSGKFHNHIIPWRKFPVNNLYICIVSKTTKPEAWRQDKKSTFKSLFKF